MLARRGYLCHVRPALAVEHLRLGHQLAVGLASDHDDLVAHDRGGRRGAGMVQRGQPLPGASTQGIRAVRLLGRQLLARGPSRRSPPPRLHTSRPGVVQCSRQPRPRGPAVRRGVIDLRGGARVPDPDPAGHDHLAVHRGRRVLTLKRPGSRSDATRGLRAASSPPARPLPRASSLPPSPPVNRTAASTPSTTTRPATATRRVLAPAGSSRGTFSMSPPPGGGVGGGTVSRPSYCSRGGGPRDEHVVLVGRRSDAGRTGGVNGIRAERHALLGDGAIDRAGEVGGLRRRIAWIFGGSRARTTSSNAATSSGRFRRGEGGHPERAPTALPCRCPSGTRRSPVSIVEPRSRASRRQRQLPPAHLGSAPGRRSRACRPRRRSG